jgi:NAD(P)-dependent dehydrogenase (short-subunit alcohol dehydrogenase family)
MNSATVTISTKTADPVLPLRLASPVLAILSAKAYANHAVEGYSESVDHEVRQHGVRVLLVEPAVTRTAFEANSPKPATPLPVYEQQRQVFERVMAAAMKDGDDPATVAEAIVAAATDPKPKLRYPAKPTAGRVSTLRRLVPARPRSCLRPADPQAEPAARLTGTPIP